MFKKIEFIHYGQSNFYDRLFEPVKNLDWRADKPSGGLWSTPVNSKYSWKEWCIDNRYKCYKLRCYFKFTFKKCAKVLVINSKRKLNAQPKRVSTSHDPICGSGLDYERLAQRYDAIVFYMKGGLRDILYTFDVDSCIVFNPSSITITERKKR